MNKREDDSGVFPTQWLDHKFIDEALLDGSPELARDAIALDESEGSDG